MPMQPFVLLPTSVLAFPQSPTGCAGDYALAVSHDLNGNRRVDRNMLGIPREAWGASNNARPRMRAPTFDEARVLVGPGEHVSIDVEVRK